MDKFDLKKFLSEGSLNNKTYWETENRKLEKAIERWVKFSMKEGDSEADILSVGQEYLKDAINKVLTNNV